MLVNMGGGNWVDEKSLINVWHRFNEGNMWEEDEQLVNACIRYVMAHAERRERGEARK